MTYAETIADEMVAWLDRDPKALIMGVGVADEKGIFGTTLKARIKYPDRVIETPLSENMLTGSLVGLAQNGYHPMLVHARSDFMTLSMEHLVNSIAKHHYMGGKILPVSVRCIIGQGWGNGPQHTQSTAHWLASVPGLNVAMPSSPRDYEEVMENVDRVPTVIYEHRRLYNSGNPLRDTDFHAPIILYGVSAARLDCEIAANMLMSKGYRVSVQSPNFVSGAEGGIGDFGAHNIDQTIVMVDVSPRGIAQYFKARYSVEQCMIDVIEPPDVPVPASAPLEAAWYPTPAQIANRVLDLVAPDESHFRFSDEDVENYRPETGNF